MRDQPDPRVRIGLAQVAVGDDITTNVEAGLARVDTMTPRRSSMLTAVWLG